MNWQKLARIFPLLALCCVAGGKKEPVVTVRFHTEANELDGAAFATPVRLRYPPREAYIGTMPDVTERDVLAVWPYTAADGTAGCAFKLNERGRIAVSAFSTERRGTSLVAFINGRQVVDMQIDAPVNDGILTIPRGLAAAEIELLLQKWPVIGQPQGKPKKPKREKKKDDLYR